MPAAVIIATVADPCATRTSAAMRKASATTGIPEVAMSPASASPTPVATSTLSAVIVSITFPGFALHDVYTPYAVHGLDEFEQRFDRMVSGVNSRAELFAGTVDPLEHPRSRTNADKPTGRE